MNLKERFSITKKFPNRYPAFTADFETIGNIGTLEAVAERSVWQSFEQLTAFTILLIVEIFVMSSRNAREPGSSSASCLSLSLD